MNHNEREAQANAVYNAGLIKVSTTSEPEGQKFPCGSFVRISKDLGESMSHFTKDTFAKVLYTYKHAFGCGGIDDYSLNVKRANGDWAFCAWYHEHQLELITDSVLIKELELEVKESEDRDLKFEDVRNRVLNGKDVTKEEIEFAINRIMGES